jgi:hypothetical protein
LVHYVLKGPNAVPKSQALASSLEFLIGYLQLVRSVYSARQRWTAIGGLFFAALMLFAGWFHYHKAAPKLAWFQNVESMLNHHLAGLLGLGSLSWAGHQVHVSLPGRHTCYNGRDKESQPREGKPTSKTRPQFGLQAATRV